MSSSVTPRGPDGAHRTNQLGGIPAPRTRSARALQRSNGTTDLISPGPIVPGQAVFTTVSWSRPRLPPEERSQISTERSSGPTGSGAEIGQFSVTGPACHYGSSCPLKGNPAPTARSDPTVGADLLSGACSQRPEAATSGPIAMFGVAQTMTIRSADPAVQRQLAAPTGWTGERRYPARRRARPGPPGARLAGRPFRSGGASAAEGGAGGSPALDHRSTRMDRRPGLGRSDPRAMCSSRTSTLRRDDGGHTGSEILARVWQTKNPSELPPAGQIVGCTVVSRGGFEPPTN